MLEVLEPGLLSSVQDLGRPDAVDLGVPEGGACERWSLRVANAVVGNPAEAAALELTLAGPALLARETCLLGLAGADLDARLESDGRTSPIRPGRSIVLRAGESLVFGTARERQGIRAYLAIAGGIDVPSVLGSASTCLVGGFGGLAGRPLAAGDVVSSAEPDAARRVRDSRWPGSFQPATEATRRALRVVRGPHVGRLPRSAFERLLTTEFRVSPRGDRQGIVLDGPRLPAKASEGGERMLSQGVPSGAVQLPPDGRPICLLADHGTVGGYPVLAVVISADLPLLAQLGPGDPLSFREVALGDALEALRAREREWQASVRQIAEARTLA